MTPIAFVINISAVSTAIANGSFSNVQSVIIWFSFFSIEYFLNICAIRNDEEGGFVSLFLRNDNSIQMEVDV